MTGLSGSRGETAALGAGSGVVGLISDTHGLVRPEARAAPEDRQRMAVVVCGHSHRPAIDVRGGTLWVNPGSAGPWRFNLPVTVARLTVGVRHVDAEVVPLVRAATR
jgi:predicted phosphodiesterase